MKIKLGGWDRKPGFKTVDIDPKLNPDYLSTAEKLPIRSNTVEYVIIDNTLEHADPYKVMKEVHRVCKPGAIVEIWVPHFSNCNVWTDLQHKRGLSYFCFDNNKPWYGFGFKILSRRILIEGRYYPWQKGASRWRHVFMAIEYLANRFPYSFERLWGNYVGGAEGLYFKLQK